MLGWIGDKVVLWVLRAHLAHVLPFCSIHLYSSLCYWNCWRENCETIKFGQLIGYNMRIIFIEKSHTNCGGKTSLRTFVIEIVQGKILIKTISDLLLCTAICDFQLCYLPPRMLFCFSLLFLLKNYTQNVVEKLVSEPLLLKLFKGKFW